jgi:hypothetical protein
MSRFDRGKARRNAEHACSKDSGKRAIMRSSTPRRDAEIKRKETLAALL